MSKPRICFVGGCGRLGLPIAVYTAYRGYPVMVADVNEAAVFSVNRVKSPVSEPYTQKLLNLVYKPLPDQEVGPRCIRATTDVYCACSWADIIFILVPTPSNTDGSFSLENITAVLRNGLAEALIDSKDRKTVVVSSTVNPGDVTKLASLIAAMSGKIASVDYDLVYNPEFIRQGSTIYDFAHPDFVLLGSPQPVPRLMEFYKSVQPPGSPAKQIGMSWESAEIAKIGLNSALVTKINTAQQLMWLCQNTEGASARDVLGIIGTDTRIGERFFLPGLFPGGPCLPRDCRALFAAIVNAGIQSGAQCMVKDLAISSATSSSEQLMALRELVLSHPGTVGILGLTYKTGVDIIEESAGLALYECLRGPRSTWVYDPHVETLDGVDSIVLLNEIVRRSDILVVTTPWDEFKDLAKMDLRDKVVIDCWGMFKNVELNAHKYILLGG